MTQDQGDSGGIAEEETLRAELYALLGWLLKAPPDAEDLQRAAALGGDDSELGRAISVLATTARARRQCHLCLYSRHRSCRSGDRRLHEDESVGPGGAAHVSTAKL